MSIIRTALATIVVVLAVTAVSAQSGGIKVTVVDGDGQPLAGATVTISHSIGYVKTTSSISDGSGTVDFPILRPGEGYAIEVTFPGGIFAPIRQDGIRVRINDTQNIPVQMLDQIQERVKVVAEREVIDIAESEASTKFSENFISDLPVPGRFYQNVLTMAPGVQDSDGDGNPNVHGSRSRDFKAVVSGLSNVDPLTGQWMSRVNPNSIEEMEVITAGAGVEFGRAQGGFARIIQKQGSNEHEGVFEFYFRSSLLDGTGARDDSDLPDPEFDWLQPAVQFSGPIIKDKLWYRLSHEFRRIENPVSVSTGIEVSRTTAATHSDQFTWQVSPRNKLSLQFQGDPVEVNNLGISSFVPPESSLTFDRDSRIYSLTWTTPFSPKVLVESVVGWQDVKESLLPTTQGQANNCVGGSDFLAQSRCFDVQRGVVSGSANTSNEDRSQRLTVRSQAQFYGGRFWGMSHQFKMGFSMENERYFRDLERRPDSSFFVFTDPGDPNDDDVEQGGSFAILSSRVAVPQQDTVRATGSNWGFYVEDQFRPRQNLTIRLGVRLDREEINSEGRNLEGVQAPAAEFGNYLQLLDDPNIGSPAVAVQKAFTGYEGVGDLEAQLTRTVCAGLPTIAEGGSFSPFQQCALGVNSVISSGTASNAIRKRRPNDINITNTNISPALSLSWSPWSNNKTVFRASIGRYHNNIPLIIPLQELEPALVDLSYRVDLKTGEPALDASIQPAVSVLQVDRDLRTPYKDEWSLAFERELWTETKLVVRYINNSFRDQIQDVNVNADTGDFGRCVTQSAPGGATVVATQPGDPDYRVGGGDGILDDCVGETIEYNASPDEPDPFGRNTAFLQRPDGILDLYRLNPLWGEIFQVGNYNQIDYESFVFELIRRQYRSWEMQASYTWSQAKGDGEDFFQEIGDDPSLRNNTFGFQSYDQRHVVKLNATTITPWGIRFGTALTWQSGLPFSLLRRELSFDASAPQLAGLGDADVARARERFLTGSRNDQRNSSWWEIDLKATKEMNLGKGLNMQLSVEVFNALNDGTYFVYTFDPRNPQGEQVNGINNSSTNFGRRWQLGMKLSF